MNANIGTIDRILRIVIGLALIVMAWTGVIGAWGWIGVVAILTAVFRYCPAYGIFGISSSKLDPSK
jgi:hypothetical protein